MAPLDSRVHLLNLVKYEVFVDVEDVRSSVLSIEEILSIRGFERALDMDFDFMTLTTS